MNGQTAEFGIGVSVHVTQVPSSTQERATTDTRQQPATWSCISGPLRWLRDAVSRWCTLEPHLTQSHDPSVGVRIGEASHPGPDMQIDLGNLNALLGPAILQQIQEQIQRAVAQAVQQALQGLNLEGASSVHASRASAPNARPAPQENEDEEWQQPKRKRRRKGKGSGEGNVAAAVSPPASTPELPRAANPGKGQGKGKGKGEVPRNAQPLSAGRGKVHQAGTGKSKGKGSVVQPSQPAGQESEWQVVTRKRSPAPVGDFTLRPEDWDAPIVTFEKLATFIEKAKGTTVEAVVHVSKEQEAVTASLIRGAGRPYKFLVLFLDKSEGSRRAPGTIDGKLVFRQAVVKELSSGAGGSAPRPKGAGATAVKMQPSVDTVVIFLRVLKSFAPAEQWKGFGLNPNKTVVQWASQHRVRVLDTFSWALEKPRAEAGEQYCGMARVRKSDLEAFLKLSGQQGVFVDTARRHGIQTSISWIDKLPGETTSAYHERAVRQGADLGVVVKANKLAWRKKLAEGEVEKRMWQVDGLPIEWDEDGVTKLLESAFAEIQILTHRRTKLGQNFRFKAAASQKDKDLIPLVAEQDGITTTYWASWALPANVSIRRKPLPRKAVPVAQIPAIKTTTVATPAVQEETQAHDGDQDMEATDKPKPEPKRVKQEVKVPPEDLLLKPMPKDGSCLFHAVSEGLKWLQDERDSHPRVLRAQVLEHMKRRRDTYLPEWDKMDPKGQPFSGTFEEYLAAMEQPTAFASDIEFKALARLLDIKLVVVPSGVHFQPMAFHHKAKRMLVLWYDALHIDLLLPKNEGSYPVHYQQVTAGPTAGLRAGGPSSVFTASSGTKAAQVRQAGRPPSVFTASTGSKVHQAKHTSRPPSVFTAASSSQHRSRAQAPGATAREKTPAETRSVAKRPRSVFTDTAHTSKHLRAQSPRSFPTAAARRTQVPGQVQEAVSDAESQDLQGCEVTAGKRAVCTTKWRDCPYKVLPKPPPDLVFKCKLCPFRKLCKSAAHYRGVRHKHDKQAHEGVSLPGPLLQPRMQRLPQKLSPGDWRCPLCKEGLRREVMSQVTSSVLCRIRKNHWKANHKKEVTRKQWTALLKAQPKPQPRCKDVSAFAQASRLRALTKQVVAEVRNPGFPGLTMFAWPRRRKHGKSERLTVEHGLRKILRSLCGPWTVVQLLHLCIVWRCSTSRSKFTFGAGAALFFVSPGSHFLKPSWVLRLLVQCCSLHSVLPSSVRCVASLEASIESSSILQTLFSF